MKKFVLLLLAISFYSCNDGNFDIPIFQFSETINSCGEFVLYKTNSTKTEVLVLNLNPTYLGTTIGESSFPISSNIPVIYRIFDQGIGTTYFCQTIPPVSPKVVKELIAESGIITIVTSEILTANVVTGYAYKITISNLLFNDTTGRIFFENFDFGTFNVTL